MENHRACSEDKKRTLMKMGLRKEFDYKHIHKKTHTSPQRLLVLNVTSTVYEA